MIPYTIFHAIFHLTFLLFSINKNGRKYLFILIPLLIFIFSAIRFDVGNDFDTYRNHFLNSKFNTLEIGQNLLFWVSNKMGGFQTYIFLTSGLIILGYSKFINYFSKNIYISYIIFITIGYFLLGSFNLIRQYVAISFFLMSIISLYKGNRFRFVLLNFIGGLFHMSGFLMIPLFFIGKKLKIKYFIILSLLIILNVDYLLSYVLTLLGKEFYLLEDWSSVMNNQRNDLFLGIYFILCLILILAVNKYFSKTEIFKNLIILSFFLIFSSSFLFPQIPNMFFFRINNFFLPFMLVLSPLMINFFTKNNRPFINFIIIFTCYCYLCFVLAIKGEEIKLIPFKIFKFY
jgi:hypothetical protein